MQYLAVKSDLLITEYICEVQSNGFNVFFSQKWKVKDKANKNNVAGTEFKVRVAGM
jgi:hypothetical protein